MSFNEADKRLLVIYAARHCEALQYCRTVCATAQQHWFESPHGPKKIDVNHLGVLVLGFGGV